MISCLPPACGESAIDSRLVENISFDLSGIDEVYRGLDLVLFEQLAGDVVNVFFTVPAGEMVEDESTHFDLCDHLQDLVYTAVAVASGLHLCIAFCFEKGGLVDKDFRTVPFGIVIHRRIPGEGENIALYSVSDMLPAMLCHYLLYFLPRKGLKLCPELLLLLIDFVAEAFVYTHRALDMFVAQALYIDVLFDFYAIAIGDAPPGAVACMWVELFQKGRHGREGACISGVVNDRQALAGVELQVLREACEVVTVGMGDECMFDLAGLLQEACTESIPGVDEQVELFYIDPGGKEGSRVGGDGIGHGGCGFQAEIKPEICIRNLLRLLMHCH